MSQIFHTLIVDDQPIIINSYKNALKQITAKNPLIEFKIKEAIDCDSSDYLIKETRRGVQFDLALVDISIPASKNMKLLSGEDVGYKLKKNNPNVKLVILTSYNDNHILCNIFKTLNPDGFLVKSDFDYQELIYAIKSVMDDIPYYSKTVTRLIRNHMSSQVTLDKIDREILFHISRGTRTKDLPEYVNLSIAGIEKRKRHLREVFDTRKKDDRALIERAREKGFI